MSAFGRIAAAAFLICAGCVHVNENSATASQAQIESRLIAQLHCQELHLTPNGKESFAGTGRNTTGDFTVEVNRKGSLITFQGNYVPPRQGGFSGSVSWNKSYCRFAGFQKSSDSSRSSFNAYSSGRP